MKTDSSFGDNNEIEIISDKLIQYEHWITEDFQINKFKELTNYLNKEKINHIYTLGRDVIFTRPTKEYFKNSLYVENIGISSRTFLDKDLKFMLYEILMDIRQKIGKCESFDKIFCSIKRNKKYEKMVNILNTEKDEYIISFNEQLEKINKKADKKNVLIIDSGIFGSQNILIKSLLCEKDQNQENIKTGIFFTTSKLNGKIKKIHEYIGENNNSSLPIFESLPKPTDEYFRINQITFFQTVGKEDPYFSPIKDNLISFYIFEKNFQK